METCKIDWFKEIIERLRDYSKGDIWSDGCNILCKTESAANAIADMLELLYRADGNDITAVTGYYDPVEDERNGEQDRLAGWWYVDIS